MNSSSSRYYFYYISSLGNFLPHLIPPLSPLFLRSSVLSSAPFAGAVHAWFFHGFAGGSVKFARSFFWVSLSLFIMSVVLCLPDLLVRDRVEEGWVDNAFGEGLVAGFDALFISLRGKIQRDKCQ